MKFFIIFILLLIIMLIQTTVLSFIRVGGVQPDLVLLVVIFNAFLRGSREGAFLGFLAGLFQDILIGNYIGFNALAKMGAGYMVGFAESKLFKDNIFVLVAVSFLATLISQIIYYTLLSVLDVMVPPFWALFRIMLPVSLYNTILAPIFYKLFYRSRIKGLFIQKEM